MLSAAVNATRRSVCSVSRSIVPRRSGGAGATRVVAATATKAPAVTSVSSLSRVLGRAANSVLARPTDRYGRVAATTTRLYSSSASTSTKGSTSGYGSRVCAILGGQWGDEGKGKLVDILAKKYNIVARFNGGNNAGHTLKVDGKKFAFHLLPCGMLYEDKINVIGNGVVVHLPSLFKELQEVTDGGIDWTGRLKLSDRAHICFDFHQQVDGMQEANREQGAKAIGTTKKGIGPTYSSKAIRHGVRLGELADWKTFEAKYRALLNDMSSMYHMTHDANAELENLKKLAEQVKPMLIDSVFYVNQALQEGKTLLAEGANAALLDLDFGTYPYVTSSSTTAGGIATGLGIAPNKIDTTIGIVKAYTTRVGAGPFPTELNDENGVIMQEVGAEFGTTTGRRRRCGWLDLPVVHYSALLNGFSSINITKLDVMSEFEEIKIGTHYTINGERLPLGMMPARLEDLGQVQVEYETVPGWKGQDISKARRISDLPENARRYLQRIEELTNIPISWVGVGAGREDMATADFEVQ